jgi:hypothetical protein
MGKGPEHSYKEGKQMTKTYMKRHSISRCQERKPKSIMRYHLKCIRLSITRKKDSMCISKYVKTLKSLYIVIGNVKWCTHYEKQYSGSSIF